MRWNILRIMLWNMLKMLKKKQINYSQIFWHWNIEISTLPSGTHSLLQTWSRKILTLADPEYYISCSIECAICKTCLVYRVTHHSFCKLAWIGLSRMNPSMNCSSSLCLYLRIRTHFIHEYTSISGNKKLQIHNQHNQHTVIFITWNKKM